MTTDNKPYPHVVDGTPVDSRAERLLKQMRGSICNHLGPLYVPTPYGLKPFKFPALSRMDLKLVRERVLDNLERNRKLLYPWPEHYHVGSRLLHDLYDLMREDIFAAYEFPNLHPHHPRIYVGKQWHKLSGHERLRALLLVWLCFSQEDPDTVVHVMDGTSRELIKQHWRRQIGEYSPLIGFKPAPGTADAQASDDNIVKLHGVAPDSPEPPEGSPSP
jgi:hypothetical protein